MKIKIKLPKLPDQENKGSAAIAAAAKPIATTTFKTKATPTPAPAKPNEFKAPAPITTAVKIKATVPVAVKPNEFKGSAAIAAVKPNEFKGSAAIATVAKPNFDWDDRDDEWKKPEGDYSELKLKPDHENRPLWITGDGKILLETSSPVYGKVTDFLITIAEPVCRPELIHEYLLTPHSLYAAVSVGLDTESILKYLNMFSKTALPRGITEFIHESTVNYGKVKLVLKKNRYFIESRFPEVLGILGNDKVIRRAVVGGSELSERNVLEIDPTQVENVKQRCLPNALNYPMMEEYDYRNDSTNASLDMELKPEAQPRPYQEKSLSKMFGNGRARSGIIVLPCGAGKSLVGVSAACRIKKSCLVLATGEVSVDQWAYQFKLWSTIREEKVLKFTAESKELIREDGASIVITTYNMIAFSGNRSSQSEKMIEKIRNTEWGLLLMDEVHVVPADTFRKVIGITKSHCKLGLTATLVREDEKITDLNFLIGPKLYEANWSDLVKCGYIANVLCAEVWCPMTGEFFSEYLKIHQKSKTKESDNEDRRNTMKKQALYAMNPNKFRACEFLIKFHEHERKDKIIVFSDNLFALKEYALKLNKPMIHGKTSHAERTKIITAFRTSDKVNTIFLSKVGDNSIDIPEANVIIQISSHGGSRRQEAQRLGRILRAKGKLEDRLAGGKEEFNAFYYSLVSTETQEMYYATKRQQFLINQGYSFKVITTIPPPQSGPELNYYNLQDQLALLSKVLKERNVNEVEEDAEDGDQKSGGKRKREEPTKRKDPNKKRHHLLKARFA